MTRLLVSVRSSFEAAAAVEAGADLIDVKEPRAGSLGAAAPEVVADVLRVVAGRRPVSIALGELIDGAADWPALEKNLTGNHQPAFAKIGLASCAQQSDWPDRWERAIGQFPIATAAVAVLYADWRIAGAPPPDAVLKVGQQIGCRAMLVDTFDKSGPGLLGHWTRAELRRHVIAARQAGMLVVLAGKVSFEQLDALLTHEPDFIAVRGAVCRDGREGQLDPERVRRLSERLAMSTNRLSNH